MILVHSAAAMVAKLSELPVMLAVQLQVVTAAPPDPPCYAPKNDFVNAFKPLLEWAFGNIRGIAPWIAAGVSLVIGLVILVKTLGRDDVGVWVKAVGWVFVGLAIILFVPAVIFAISTSAPVNC
ncbi:MAG TPA: hypothetical protein PLN95_01985 [Candidatus Saccharibacteria bacterium]|nr:hypothetical protein [Candidatus Saccharibacteria bacterium]